MITRSGLRKGASPQRRFRRSSAQSPSRASRQSPSRQSKRNAKENKKPNEIQSPDRRRNRKTPKRDANASPPENESQNSPPQPEERNVNETSDNGVVPHQVPTLDTVNTNNTQQGRRRRPARGIENLFRNGRFDGDYGVTLSERFLKNCMRRNCSTNTYEFAGKYANMLIMMLLPCITVAIFLCSSNTCSSQVLEDVIMYNNIPLAMLLVSTQLFLQSVLSVVPIFGTKWFFCQQPKSFSYFNGIFASIVTLVLFFTAEYHGFLKHNIVLKEYQTLTIVSYIFSFFLSLVLHWNSFEEKVERYNPFGFTGLTVHDFWVGRVIQPTAQIFNVKICIMRYCYVTAVSTLTLFLFYTNFHFSEYFLNIKFVSVILNFNYKK